MRFRLHPKGDYQMPDLEPWPEICNVGVYQILTSADISRLPLYLQDGSADEQRGAALLLIHLLRYRDARVTHEAKVEAGKAALAIAQEKFPAEQFGSIATNLLWLADEDRA